ncbi:uncharacterized protein KY384_001558 [Bacidia gigantensis]|uniref:uncharacterized protein n=1 Tax=Bacidia gigantensis TaxID=2732470 RepID=UPI001D04A670|nr:uncharacterized protein KY384_001558 [Bacidia gigantensis]KAG8533817.1 hypothetical protein KY384_001558 [Bacidia gigantensis]
MPADVDGPRDFSPPPRYSESNNVLESKDGDPRPHNHGQWLLRRTSIHIESSAADVESSRCTSISSGSTGPNRAGDGFFQKNGDHGGQGQANGGLGHHFGALQLGSRVVIEATHPTRSRAERRVELKGLEQAASAKRWSGSGRPAELWGKLMQDPELWDEGGDTYIYFGYQRPTPSFLIKASLLEEMKSDHLMSKLHDAKDSRSFSPSTKALSSLGGFKSLAIGRKSPRAGLRPRVEAHVCRDIYFPAPLEASRLDILRYHLTTRNVFALLLNKPLVGLTFYQALVDLQERLEDLAPTSPSAETIINYLIRNRFHNVSNEPSAAVGLLGWSEDNLWLEGWREGYVHCTGMYSKLRPMPEFGDLSHTTRSSLERSKLELTIKIEQAEQRLATFHFDDMWLIGGQSQRSVPARFSALRRFFQRHYGKVYKSWPPRPAKGCDAWLTRNLVARLKEDFGALYRYYVDQDIVWDDANQSMIYRSDLTQKSQSKALFGSRTKATEKRTLPFSNEASDANILSSNVMNNLLVESFIKFDRVDNSGKEDPHDVRKMRWLLIYGILQSISYLTFDTPHICFTDGADYFTNARLNSIIPWKADETCSMLAQPDVHSWLIP